MTRLSRVRGSPQHKARPPAGSAAVAGARRGTPLPASGAPDFATYACVLLILVTGVRLHEFTFLGAVPNLAIIAAGLTLLAALSTRGLQALHVADNPTSRWLLFIVGYAGLSITWSVWRGLSFWTFVGAIMAAWVVFLSVAAAADSWQRQRVVLMMATLAVVVTALIYFGFAGADRLKLGSMYDSNDIATLFASTVPLLILLRPQAAARLRYLPILVAYAMLAAGVVASQSRGGFIAFLFATLLLVRALIETGRRRTLVAAAVMALMVGALGGAVALGPQEARQRFESLFDISSDYNLTDDTGRIAVWTRGLQSIRDYPFGTGVGTSTVADGLQGGRYQAPHNSALQVGIELGIPGLFAFGALLLSAWRAARGSSVATENAGSARVQGEAVAGAILAFLVGAFFLTLAYTAWLYFLVALLVAPSMGARLRARQAHG